jgi:hypothetical protein
MKDPMEKHFKDIFKEHELPFDPAAWDQLSKRLDVVMPVNKPKNNWKWYLGGAAILLSASGLLWKLSSEKTNIDLPATNATSTTVKANETEGMNPSNESNDVNQTSFNSNSQGSEKSTASINQSQSQEIAFTETSSSSESDPGKVNQKMSYDMKTDNPVPTKNSDPIITGNNSSAVYPAVKDLCEGESIWIKNDNSQDLFLTDNSKVYPISAGKRINFTGENAGNYYFGHTVNGKIQYSKTPDFRVKEGMKADMSIDLDTKYEQGVPTVNLQASSNENATYTWSIEGSKIELRGKEVKAHLYKKGTYDVVLTAEPKDNSCPASVKKQIRIEEDYNLLAVNSFWPNSNDPRNSTFMPYALKERNVDFTMLVIDPTNGATLFETNDATNGWTGINKMNGQLVDENKAYIWVVRIKNPLPDEKAEYKGTIVRLP